MVLLLFQKLSRHLPGWNHSTADQALISVCRLPSSASKKAANEIESMVISSPLRWDGHLAFHLLPQVIRQMPLKTKLIKNLQLWRFNQSTIVFPQCSDKVSWAQQQKEGFKTDPERGKETGATLWPLWWPWVKVKCSWYAIASGGGWLSQLLDSIFDLFIDLEFTYYSP